MFIEDYMSPDPVTVRQNAQIAEAARLMRQHHFRQLPVMDQGGRLVGIITDRDLRQTVGFGEPLREKLIVADVMTADPVTIPLSATVDDAVRVLVEHRFGALPVVRANTPPTIRSCTSRLPMPTQNRAVPSLPRKSVTLAITT